MITNYCIAPETALRPFVNQYILSTSEGRQVTYTSQWPAGYEVIMLFYLRDQPDHSTENSGSSLSGKNNYVVGPVTHNNGWVDFNGIYHTFIIEFRPDGFNKIFGLPGSEINNRVLSAELFFGDFVRDFHDALANENDFVQMAYLADRFLLAGLNVHKYFDASKDAIRVVANELTGSGAFLRVSGYANACN